MRAQQLQLRTGTGRQKCQRHTAIVTHTLSAPGLKCVACCRVAMQQDDGDLSPGWPLLAGHKTDSTSKVRTHAAPYIQQPTTLQAWFPSQPLLPSSPSAAQTTLPTAQPTARNLHDATRSAYQTASHNSHPPHPPLPPYHHTTTKTPPPKTPTTPHGRGHPHSAAHSHTIDADPLPRRPALLGRALRWKACQNVPCWQAPPQRS